jgi:type I restriction enzyme S subunit
MKTAQIKLKNSFTPYPKYRDSGIEWIGKIPKEWEGKKISSVFEFPKDKVSDEDYEPLSVTYGGIKKQVETAAKSDDGTNRKKVLKGDVAINGRSDRKGAVGVSAYDGSISLVYHVLRRRSENTETKFFHYLFRSKLFSEEFYRWGRGIVDDLWTTRSDEMKRIGIPVPPVETQKKIAEYLDEKTALIDQIIEKKKKLIELLREKRTAVINNAVTRGASKGEWRNEKIKHLVKSIEAGVWGENPLENSDDIKCLRVADFDYENLSFSNVETVRNNPSLPKKKILQKGDILMEKSGGGEKTPVGRAVLFESNERIVCANFIDIVRVNKEKVLPEFLILFLSVLYSQRLNTKYIKQNTGIQNMDIKAYFGEMVSFPKKEDQKDIVDFVHGKMNSFDQLILKAQKSVEALKEFKSSLISNVVTGKNKV